MNPIFETHFAQLKAQYTDAQLEQNPSVGLVVLVPNVSTGPTGSWNMPTTNVRFVVPVGYPQAQPDCFFADRELKLVNGVQPDNSAENVQLGTPYLWFSWHVSRWEPRTDTLLTYLRVIRERLKQGR